MSARTLRVFREMAEDQGLLERRPRQRWREQVRLIARERGWRFTDAWLHVMYRDCDLIMGLCDLRGPDPGVKGWDY